MKNLSLIAFALMILLGWTAVAAGMIAALAGEPNVITRQHDHKIAPLPEGTTPSLYSRVPCPVVPAEGMDGSVPCEA
jgi:hypothetical protein